MKRLIERDHFWRRSMTGFALSVRNWMDRYLQATLLEAPVGEELPQDNEEPPAERPGFAGAPAHWLDRVRRGAPELLLSPDDGGIPWMGANEPTTIFSESGTYQAGDPQRAEDNGEGRREAGLMPLMKPEPEYLSERDPGPQSSAALTSKPGSPSLVPKRESSQKKNQQTAPRNPSPDAGRSPSPLWKTPKSTLSPESKSVHRAENAEALTREDVPNKTQPRNTKSAQQAPVAASDRSRSEWDGFEKRDSEHARRPALFPTRERMTNKSHVNAQGPAKPQTADTAETRVALQKVAREKDVVPAAASRPARDAHWPAASSVSGKRGGRPHAQPFPSREPDKAPGHAAHLEVTAESRDASLSESYWPELPPELPEDLPPSRLDLEHAMRTWQRSQRISLEQRGEV